MFLFACKHEPRENDTSNKIINTTEADVSTLSDVVTTPYLTKITIDDTMLTVPYPEEQKGVGRIIPDIQKIDFDGEDKIQISSINNDVFERNDQVLINIKYCGIYDTYVYNKITGVGYWLSGAAIPDVSYSDGVFETYYKNEIESLKNNNEGYPYYNYYILSLSPNGRYALFQRSVEIGSIHVKYYIYDFNTLNETYLFDGYNTKNMISWLEDRYEWIDDNYLRIASWTDKYDELYIKENIRKMQVFDIKLKNDEITVSESDISFVPGLDIWVKEKAY
jgi:hypothetical protein